MQSKKNTNNTHKGTAKAVLDQDNAEADTPKQTAQTQTGGQQTDQQIEQTGPQQTDQQIEQTGAQHRSPTNRAEDKQSKLYVNQPNTGGSNVNRHSQHD